MAPYEILAWHFFCLRLPFSVRCRGDEGSFESIFFLVVMPINYWETEIFRLMLFSLAFLGWILYLIPTFRVVSHHPAVGGMMAIYFV